MPSFFFVDLLTKEHERSDQFIASMRGLYPSRLGYLQPGDIEILEHEIQEAHLTWDSNHINTHDTDHVSTTHSQGFASDTFVHSTPASNNTTKNHSRKRRASVVDDCKCFSTAQTLFDDVQNNICLNEYSF